MIKGYFEQVKKRSTGLACTLDMLFSTVVFGASPNNYADFGFSNLSLKERNSYVTNGFSRKIIKKYNDMRYEQYFEDKTLFAETFSEFFNRSWISTRNLSKESFEQFIDNKKRFIFKPVGNAQGQGIRVYNDLSNCENLFQDICKSGDAILEDWIEQHEVLDAVYSEAINCLRVITIYDNGKTHFITGGITWGNGMQIANASASGIVSPIDFETGILDKPAADFKGNVFYKHPITGTNLVGIKVPYWNEVVDMLEKASCKIPQIRYVGWDVAITPNGPVIIEGNTTPGYRYYQIPVHHKNHVGNKHLYKINR